MSPQSLPFSKLRRVGQTLFVSGELGFGDDGLILDGIQAQTLRTLQNIEALLRTEGLDRHSIVQCTCYLVHKEDFAAFNAAYRAFFESVRVLPARATVVADLVVPDACIEIAVVAAYPQG